MPKTLEKIQNKIRKLIQKPSTKQITNDQINENIDDFMLYDFPTDLRLFDFTRNFTFYTQPYIDEYKTNETDTDDPFYNFRNKYISVHPPVYVDGYETAFYQEQDYFYSHWRKTAAQINVATGDGGSNFTGTIDNAPLMQGSVMFESITSNNRGLVLHDVPVVDANGNPTNDGNLYIPGQEPSTPPTSVESSNTINYVTGVFDITFTTDVPDNGADITAHIVDYGQSRPEALLYFNDTIKLRPVPDKVYKIDMQVYIRPTALANQSDEPYLAQMGEYIAYGASRKILQDDSRWQDVAYLDPEFKRQEDLLRTRTCYQLSNQRAKTEYDEIRFFGPWWPKYYR